MRPTVFVDGDQGTTGLQILARLAGRDDLTLLTLPGDRRKDARWRAEAINSCDIAILCLPDAAAREAAAMVTNPAVRVIDASSAHRTDAAWVYGFAEMTSGQPGRIAAARRVSNPGCYPTGAIALLRPLIEGGLLPADHPVTVHAVSGYSGAGRSVIETYENGAPGLALPLKVYGLDLEHKHVGEIERHAGLSERPIFVPAYGAFRQGIVLTIPLHLRLLPRGVDGARLHAQLQSHYAAASQVELMPLDAAEAVPHLDPRVLNGRDGIRLGVFHNPKRQQAVLAAVYDNLGKGASGAAVQNLGLMLQP